MKIKLFFLVLTISLFSCSTDNCQDKLGKNKKNDVSFRKENNWEQSKINQFNVFLENSVSMDGYVNGTTRFKGDLLNLIQQVSYNAIDSKGTYNLYYINNDTIINRGKEISGYITNLSPNMFKNSGGKRGSTDIAGLLERVIKDKTKSGDVSMFISDCIFSPSSDDNIDVYLGAQESRVRSIVESKLSQNDKFAVLVYRFVSDFKGNCYKKNDEAVSCSADRPYFVWFFGNYGHIKKISDLVCDAKLNYTHRFVAFNVSQTVPYKSPQANCKSSKGKHIKEPNEKKNKKYYFKIDIDLTSIPLLDAELLDIKNYEVSGTKDFSITEVERFENTKKGKKSKKGELQYTHELTATLIGKHVKTNVMVNTSLLNPSLKTWNWASIEDPKGDDFEKTPACTSRTFGIKQLLNGVYNAYPRECVNTKILIK